MTASTVYSLNATDFRASPRVQLDRKQGTVKTRIDHAEVGTASLNEVGDKVMMMPIPTNAILLSLRLLNDDLDAHACPTLDMNIGLYYTGTGPQSGVQTEGTAADDNLFVDDTDEFASANTTPVELNSLLDNIVDIKKPLWERAGLSSDPGGHFYIGLEVGTNAAATAQAGDVVLIAEYI